jgi:hypothetical protein
MLESAGCLCLVWIKSLIVSAGESSVRWAVVLLLVAVKLGCLRAECGMGPEVPHHRSR